MRSHESRKCTLWTVYTVLQCSGTRCIWLLVCFKGLENGYGSIGLAKYRVFLWFCEDNELSGFIND